ncbi:hypothetical protein ACET3Z_006932 [Daucus carota]
MASTSGLKAQGIGEPSCEAPVVAFTEGNKDHQDDILASEEGFTPYVIDVYEGQDIMSKIIDFCKQVPDQIVCVMSAFGTLSEITFKIPFVDKITYEGLFDILRLSGSFEPVNLGEFGRKGGLSIIFSRKDGKVEGGRVIGQLKVASFARINVGTFKKHKRGEKEEPVFVEEEIEFHA